MNLLDIKPNIVSKSVKGKYFLFYGEPSTRKTSVAAMFPNALLLATEIGYSLIPGVYAENIKNWGEFRTIIRELKKDEVKARYETIVIDTVGLLTDMCMQYICDINNVPTLSDLPWGGGWTQFKKEFRTQINTIAQAGYGIVFIAHSDPKRNEAGDLVSALPVLDKKPRESVIALVDFVLYLQKEAKDSNSQEITVYAYSKLPSQIETKTRARYLAPRFEFNFQNLEKEIVEAITKYEAEGIEVSDTSVNLYAAAENAMPFEELRQQVLDIAGPLVDEAAAPEIRAKAVTQIRTIMKDVRVSEADVKYYDNLVNLREALLEIRDSI